MELRGYGKTICKGDMEGRYGEEGYGETKKALMILCGSSGLKGYYLPTPYERQSFSSQSSSSSASTKQALQRLLGLVSGSFLPQMQTMLICLPSM
jgi:hypothetical protein